MIVVSESDPRYVAAKAVLDAMHTFWELAPQRAAIQWIEDTEGRVVIFTRGEYRDAIMEVVRQHTETEFFALARGEEEA